MGNKMREIKWEIKCAGNKMREIKWAMDDPGFLLLVREVKRAGS